MGVLALPPEAAGGKWGEVCGERRQLEPEPWDPYLLWGQRRQLGGRCAGALLGDKIQDRQEPWGWRMGQRHLQSWAGRGLRTAGLGPQGRSFSQSHVRVASRVVSSPSLGGFKQTWGD